MGIEYPPAIDMFIDDPAWVFTDALKGLDGEQLSIVLHKTACGGPCDAVSVASFFAHDTSTRKSVHFIVGTDGTVVQVVHLKDGAGGNCCLEAGHDPYWDTFQARYGNLNRCTISIEHIDTTNDNSEVMAQTQIDASFALVSWLVQKFGIPLSHIKGHNTLDPISRARCPGPMYPLDELMSYLQGGTMIPVVCNSPAVTEFTQGQEFDCGAAAVATMAWSTKPGNPSRTDTQAEQNWFVHEYLNRPGASDPNDQNSNSIPDMRQYFKDTQSGGTPNEIHYWEYDHLSYDAIVAALKHGYPSIVTVSEQSVFDLDLNETPYPWHYGHIFAITGLDPQGNYLVFDTANMDSGGTSGNIRQWPRRYDKNKLSLSGYGAIVGLPWLPGIPSGDPLSWGTSPTPTPTPTPAPDKAKAFAQEWGSTGLDPKTGIAQAAYATYWTDNFAGGPVSPEFELEGKNGKVYTAQRVNMGIWLWDGSAAHYFPYKAG